MQELDRVFMEKAEDNLASAPAVAWNGTNFIVVWSSYHSLHASLLDRNGVPMSATAAELYPVENPQALDDATVAWNGRSFDLMFRHQPLDYLPEATGVATQLSP